MSDREISFRCQLSPIMSGQKTCRICGSSLPVDAFYARPGSADGRRSECKDCCNRRNRQWVNTNRNARRKHAREWAQRNAGSESLKAASRIWHERNRQKVNQQSVERGRLPHVQEYRRSYRRRPDVMRKQRERVALWLKSDAGRNYRAQWGEANRDARIASTHKRRARLRGAAGSYSAIQWKHLVSLCGGRCLRCEAHVALSVDHVVPLSINGWNSIDNLQPLCLKCNPAKGDRAIDYRPLIIRLWAMMEAQNGQL